MDTSNWGLAARIRLLCAIGVIFSSVSLQANAGITGSELLKACENTHILAYHKQCYHYIEGFYYGQHFALQMANAEPILCAPKAVTWERMRQVFVSWAWEYPQHLDANAYINLMSALLSSYRCDE